MRLNPRRALKSCAALLFGAALVTGCESKSFIDPSELSSPPKKPLVVPILNHLDVGIEEPNREFYSARPPRPEDAEYTAADYTLGASDFLSVSITDLVGPNIETVKNVRVTESGRISLPLIGQIQASGLTEAQLEAAIAQAYRDANIIQNATVSVTVLEARNRTFSILGSVTQPGQYALVPPKMRVLDALVLARGILNEGIGVENIYIIRQLETEDGATTAPATQPAPDLLTPRSRANGGRSTVAARKPLQLMIQPADPAAPATEPAMAPETPGAPAAPEAPVDPANRAGRSVIIDGREVPLEGPTTAPTDAAVAPETTPAEPFEFQEPAEPTDVRVIRVPYQALRNGELKYNIYIRPQDMIYVPGPVVGEYYMGGHVARPGVFSLTGRKITLKQAVISSGMLDQVAIPGRTQIVRRIQGEDKEIFARVDLGKVFAGEQPDIYLKPDDQVIVGTTWWAPFVAAVRNGFRITYGFGFLYDRNYWEDDNIN